VLHANSRESVVWGTVLLPVSPECSAGQGGILCVCVCAHLICCFDHSFSVSSGSAYSRLGVTEGSVLLCGYIVVRVHVHARVGSGLSRRLPPGQKQDPCDATCLANARDSLSLVFFMKCGTRLIHDCVVCMHRPAHFSMCVPVCKE
jgi:hypothetical protein